MKRPALQRGLSLLELMVALGIASLVLALGVPSFQGVIQNNRIVSTTNELITSLAPGSQRGCKAPHHGRHLRQRRPGCRDARFVAAILPQGWIAFVDRNGNGVVNPNADPALDDTILRVQPAIHASLAPQVDGGAYVAFAASGYGRDIGALGARAAAIVVCDDRGNKDVADGISAARVVVLTETGRPDTLRHVDDVTDYGGCP